jgi:lysophospholipase L1-like esterase
MKVIRSLIGASAVTVSALVLIFATNKGWTPIDRPLPPVRSGQNALRIVAFGTSLTGGGTWPEDLAPALSRCLGRPVEVTRVAKAGASSAWGLSAVGDVIAAMPDVVLIEFAINDADLRDGLWPSASQARHEEILSSLAAALPEASLALMTMSPAHGPRGWMRPRLAAYYRSYEGLAAAHGIGLIDLYARWLTMPHEKEWFPDGLHPDFQRASGVIVPAVTKAIGKASGANCT